MKLTFADELVAYQSADVFNPWREWDALDVQPNAFAAGMRMGRLLQHFDCDPLAVVIGEAPGYQGCRYTGVPFTSERQLLGRSVPRIRTADRITTRDPSWAEPSATIVWKVLHALGIADRIVLWNAFAWHPHRPGEPHSNRTPTLVELDAGAPVLRDVLEHFRGVPVVAAGRQAEWLLKRLGVAPAATVRHPSMGGATAFRDGLSAYISEHTTRPTEPLQGEGRCSS